jgi:FSR family fosmidomycin resistance protein-like MFS transporter
MSPELRKLIPTIFLLWLSHLLVDFMIGIWSVYKTMAHLDLALAGMIAGASAFIGESLQMVFGSWSDRGYRGYLILLGLVLTAVSTLMAYTENYAILFVLFLVTCIGSGAFHPSAVSAISQISGKRKALFMTIFQSGGSLGLASSQLIFSQSFYALEGQTAFLALPALLLAGCFFYNRIGASPAPSSIQTLEKKKSFNFKAFIAFAKNPDLIRLYITLLCNQSIIWATVFLLPDILLSRGYESWLSFGGAHLFFILGGGVAMIPAGYLADRYSCKAVMIGGTLSGIAAFVAFLSIPLLSPYAVCVLLSLLGASLGAVTPIGIALGHKLCPESPGMVSAFLMGMVWCVAEGLGQGGGGMLTTLFTEDAPAKALGILGFLLLVGTFASLRLPVNQPVEEMEVAL